MRERKQAGRGGRQIVFDSRKVALPHIGIGGEVKNDAHSELEFVELQAQ
jgi:hypothetical protein